MPDKTAGLRDVVAGSSTICYLDGESGILRYCGYPIEQLARESSFEEVAYLLWNGELPAANELRPLSERLAQFRVPQPVWNVLSDLGPIQVIDSLRTGISALAGFDADYGDDSPPALMRKSERLTSQAASIVAGAWRISQGQAPVDPDPALGFAANFLYQLRGERPSQVAARSLDIALILHAEHELNASTFAGRVIVATLTDVHSAVTGAIGALKGPLHGGANAAALQMLLEIGAKDNAERQILNRLAARQLVMGFGHAVYRTADPRAGVLREMSRQLGEDVGDLTLFELSEAIEAIMMREKGLNANVDFYSASVYHNLGIPVELFTPIFAISRMTGWTAHIIEQVGNNRIIRPRLEYTGAWERDYVPMAKRGQSRE